MSTNGASEFLRTFIQDAVLQQQLADSVFDTGTLTFGQWQMVARAEGHNFSETEFEVALNADPALLPELNRLAAEYNLLLQPELDFELTDDELETVAGGCTGPNCNGETAGNGRYAPQFKV
jgi:hypothetical protein